MTSQREREKAHQKESVRERQSQRERERQKERESDRGRERATESESDRKRQHKRNENGDRDRERKTERHTQTPETESFTTISCWKCSAMYPTLLPALSRAQTTSSLEKDILLPCLIVISGLGGNQFTCNLHIAAI